MKEDIKLTVFLTLTLSHVVFGCLFVFYGQVHKNISDSENVKANVKFQSSKTDVLTVQKLT